MNPVSKEDEEKGPYQEFDPKPPVEDEKPMINFLVKGFFGESNPIQRAEIIEVNSSGGDDDDDDEGMSPISPLKGKGTMNEEERISKIQELKFQHKELSIKLNSVDDRINKINNKEEEQEEQDESSRVKLTQLQKQRELLTKTCDDIIAIKEGLENPNLNLDSQKNKNIDQTQSKIAEHEKKLQSHKRKLLMTKIRVKILELFRRVSSRKIEELENDDGTDDKLSCDTYLFTSLLLEYLIFFLLFLCFIIVVMSLLMVYHLLALIFHPILVLLKCSTKESLIKSFQLGKVHIVKFGSVLFQISVILMFFSFLFSPGVLVVVTQIYCISNLQTVTYSGTLDSSGLILLKELMIIFFFFLSMKEVSSAIANIGYHYKRTIVENSYLILLPVRACPQLLQIVMTFWFCYINIYLIEQVDDVANLIQNFAALAVVLEFDNYVMGFLRYMKLYKIYHKFLENILGKHDKKRMSKADKEKEIEGLLSSISQYEKLLHEIRETRNKNKKSEVAETVEMKKEIVKQIKDQEKKENLKKKIPPIPAKTINHESSQNQKEKISVFFHILDSIMDENENAINGAINFLAQKNAIKIMLTKEEFPIEAPFVLGKLEKLIFDLVGFVTVGTGILVIILVFAS